MVTISYFSMTCCSSFTAQLLYKNCTDLLQPWNKRTPPWSLATIGVARHCGDQSLPCFDLSVALIASIKRSAVISQTYDTGSWRQGHQGWPPLHGEAIKSGRAGELEDFLTRHNGANKVTLISYWPLVPLSNFAPLSLVVIAFTGPKSCQIYQWKNRARPECHSLFPTLALYWSRLI